MAFRVVIINLTKEDTTVFSWHLVYFFPVLQPAWRCHPALS